MKRISKYCDTVMNQLIHYPTLGCENTNIVDMLVALLLVTSPLLQHYKGIVVNAGILVLIACLPYVCLKLLFRFRSLELKNTLIVLPLALFQVFRIFAHGTTFMELAHGAVLCGYFIAIALGGINLKYVARAAYVVAMAAGIGIILQSVCYYLFGFHLQFVVTELLLEESNAWIRLAETGVISVTGAVSAFYRPSAFFLEPSHMFLYFIPNLCLLLLTPEMNWFKRMSAVILSAGLLLSTSGMGIVLVAGVWLLHLGFGAGKENVLRFANLFSKRNIQRCISFVLVFAVIALALPFMRYSIMRIFLGNEVVNQIIAAEKAEKEEQLGNQPTEKPEPEQPPTENNGGTEKPPMKDPADKNNQAGSTAISGRVERAISLIRYKMKGLQYVVGVTDSVDDINFNLPGFFATMYKYGMIGTVLSYVFYVVCAMFAKGAYRWMAVIILGVSFFSAHTHGTFYMIFYVLLLMDGIVRKRATNNDCVEPAC